MRFKLVWLTVCAMAITGCTSQQFEQEQEQWRERQRQREKERDEKDKQWTAEFPSVYIGMPFVDLLKAIEQQGRMDDGYGKVHHNITLEHETYFDDGGIFVFAVNKGYDWGLNTNLIQKHVTVTVRGQTVVGYSK